VIVEDMPCISIGQLHLQPNEERPGIITSTDPAILYQINTLDDEMPVVVFSCDRTTTAVRLVSKPNTFGLAWTLHRLGRKTCSQDLLLCEPRRIRYPHCSRRRFSDYFSRVYRKIARERIL
jgi:hypothetical protein